MSTITLGLRSSIGRKRLTVSSGSTASALRTAIRKELGIDEEFNVRIDKNGKPGDEIRLGRSGSVASLRIKHGDVLYITPISGTRFKDDDDDDSAMETSTPSLSASSSAVSLLHTSSSVSSFAGSTSAEDEVDLALYQMDGLIAQSKSPNCQHGAKQKCVYCVPKEPYDEEYLRQEGIKHMSFHAYLRKLAGGVTKGKYAALEDITCKIKKGCTTHKPWPASVCSKCLPPAITLNRQTYRHVDNVMFENAEIVSNFLSYWRTTGNQRIGFMYGRYEVFEDVPLGIKAVVAAIYEPPQECSRDEVKLIPDENEAKVEEMASHLGLKKVGWIFTDLLPDSKGNVKHLRNIDTHFLSAQECIMAGFFQSKYPNVCKKSSTGTFGSKFCSVVVTGNKEKQVHMEGYQVSNQCMALVRDECLIPTVDASELGYVKESSSKQYVPDVFYKKKDNYGNEVMKISRPLPVEYLLIDVPVSTPKDPVRTFYAAKNPFPIENRPMEGHLQDFSALGSYRKEVSDVQDLFRDFHLLLYLATQTVNPIYDQMKPLLEAIKDNREDAILAWANSENWQTIELLLEAQNGGFQ